LSEPMHADDPRKRRRLSNYLLDKSLQLRYVAVITAISAVIAGVLGYLIWMQEARASAAVMASFQASELAAYPGLAEEIQSRLTRQDSGLAGMMVGVGVGLAFVLSLYVLLMTHKVAGPLYKISRYFDAMSEGKLGKVTALRRGDMLTDFYETFQRSHEAVRERHRRHNEVMSKFLLACEDAQVPTEGEAGHMLEELRAHRDRRDRDLA
jgi:hypothetical protein